jgi:hypothetical protein
MVFITGGGFVVLGVPWVVLPGAERYGGDVCLAIAAGHLGVSVAATDDEPGVGRDEMVEHAVVNARDDHGGRRRADVVEVAGAGV